MKNLKINMALYSLKTFVHSLKNAINPAHKIPKSKKSKQLFYYPGYYLPHYIGHHQAGVLI
jgi:hypothetical protein